MSIKILIVFHNPDQADRVKEILEEQLTSDAHDVFVDLVRNESRAREKLRTKWYDLLITHLHIPVDKETPLREDEKRGLKLIQALQRENQIFIPNVLVLVKEDSELFTEVKDLSKCSVIYEGEHFGEQLLNLFKGGGLSQLGEIREQEICNLDVEFSPDKGDKRNWHYKLSGRIREMHYRDDGVLRIDLETMEDLASRSKNIQTITDWEKELHAIGRTLTKELFKNNPTFDTSFAKVEWLVAEKANIRFRFQVAKEFHPIVLEALIKKVGDEDRYWMLSAPIYRRLDIPGEVYLPLFQKEKPEQEKINCLIIQADVEGYLPGLKDEQGLDLELVKLLNIEEECEWLQNYLLTHQAEFNLGKIVKVTEPPGELSFSEHVRNLLETEYWHLVHYAGHSFYDDKHGEGYVFFPTKEPAIERVEKVEIEEFSCWLRRAKNRFIYLSSCRSSKEDFVLEIASKRIPAVIGYRWDIDDDKAAEHAKFFYKHLFEGKRSLEYAFLETRKIMHRDNRENRVWASPMLIMQSGNH